MYVLGIIDDNKLIGMIASTSLDLILKKSELGYWIDK